jgi:hypothetical protein
MFLGKEEDRDTKLLGQFLLPNHAIQTVKDCI